MSKKSLEILKAADAVTPFAEVNGAKVVSFEDAVTLAQAEAIEPEVDLGDRKFNPDGTYARSKVKVVAINPDNFYANRYKLVKSKNELHVVTDYRSIQYKRLGQPCGFSTVPCYVIVRENGELKLDRLTTISAADFDAGFNAELNNAAAAEVFRAINASKKGVTGDELPI